MFDTTKDDLRDILRAAHEGRLQLSDFQRSYVWGDHDVCALIASIARGFPVGALLTLQVTLRRDALLALPLGAYRRHADAVEEGFRRADAFLNRRKIMRARDIPHPPQVVALAAFHAAFGDRALSHPQERRLARWFWTVALGEVYGSATETKIARDVMELLPLIGEDGPEPQVIERRPFREDRLMTLRTRNSAAYDALHALLMARGSRDFIAGNPVEIATFHHDRIGIHHVFPNAWCEARGLDRGVWNSIVNTAPLSAASNRSIGGRAPSEYLRRIERERGLSEADLDEILRSHLIEPALLRADDFEGFVATRRRALADLLAEVVKHVSRDAPPEEPKEDASADEEDVGRDVMRRGPALRPGGAPIPAEGPRPALHQPRHIAAKRRVAAGRGPGPAARRARRTIRPHAPGGPARPADRAGAAA